MSDLQFILSKETIAYVNEAPQVAKVTAEAERIYINERHTDDVHKAFCEKSDDTTVQITTNAAGPIVVDIYPAMAANFFIDLHQVCTDLVFDFDVRTLTSDNLWDFRPQWLDIDFTANTVQFPFQNALYDVIRSVQNRVEYTTQDFIVTPYTTYRTIDLFGMLAAMKSLLTLMPHDKREFLKKLPHISLYETWHKSSVSDYRSNIFWASVLGINLETMFGEGWKK